VLSVDEMEDTECKRWENILALGLTRRFRTMKHVPTKTLTAGSFRKLFAELIRPSCLREMNLTD
jgi:hypothetical protein